MMRILILIFLTLWPLASAQAGFYESMARGSYRLLVGDCTQKSEVRNSQTEAQAPCLKDPCSLPAITQLQSHLGEINESIYLRQLADTRIEALTCGLDQLNNVLKKPEEVQALAHQFAQKIESVFDILNRIQELEPAIQARNRRPDLEEKKLAYQKAHASLSAVMSSFPFMHIPAISSLVKETLASNAKAFTRSELTTKQKQEFIEKFKAALEKGTQEVKADITSLKEPDLTSALKESLAQDTDLVESLRQKHEPLPRGYQATACEVDAKYGKGAEYRDYAFIGASMLVGGAVIGAMKAGASTMAAMNAIRGAAAVGSVSTRTSLILRSTALAGEAGLQLALANVDRSCSTQNQLSATKNENKCDPSLFRELAHESCVLNIALTALGTKAITEGVAGGIKYLARSKARPPTITTVTPAQSTIAAMDAERLIGTRSGRSKFTFERHMKKQTDMLDKMGVQYQDLGCRGRSREV